MSEGDWIPPDKRPDWDGTLDGVIVAMSGFEAVDEGGQILMVGHFCQIKIINDRLAGVLVGLIDGHIPCLVPTGDKYRDVISGALDSQKKLLKVVGRKQADEVVVSAMAKCTPGEEWPSDE